MHDERQRVWKREDRSCFLKTQIAEDRTHLYHPLLLLIIDASFFLTPLPARESDKNVGLHSAPLNRCYFAFWLVLLYMTPC